MNVVCAILEFNQKILFTCRNKDRDLGLHWEFPGGKVEENETETAALMREIKEELAISIEPFERLQPVRWDRDQDFIRLIPYRCRLIEKSPLVLIDHGALKWEIIKNAKQLKLGHADRLILNQI